MAAEVNTESVFLQKLAVQGNLRVTGLVYYKTSLHYQTRRFRQEVKTIRILSVFAVFVLLSIGGCASYKPEDILPSDESLLQFTDEPVRDIQFSRLIEWYGYNRDHLVLRFNHQKWYALSVLEPCIADVRQARKFRLDTVVSTRLGVLDRVVVDGRTCRINEIRPLDHNAFRESRDRYLASLGDN